MATFNHQKLLGRIKEYGFTQETLAKQIKMTSGTLCFKLNNKSHFTTEEMDSISRLLDISPDEIGTYFFTK